MNKPNAVVFKLDDGTLVGFRIVDGKWDFDMLVKFQKVTTDSFQDLSAVNPFEWAFVWFDGQQLTTTTTKTTIPGASFLKLYDAGLLTKTIEADYNYLWPTNPQNDIISTCE